MLFKDIFKGLNIPDDESDFTNYDFSGISRDSTKIKQGDIYFCLSNDEAKAEKRCRQAIDNGARVVVSDFSFAFPENLEVKDCRDMFARACANFYERACDDLKIVGITGTNGKTTTSHVVAQMLQRNGHKVGVIGTSGVFFDGKQFDCPLTTPDADFLHRTFFEMREKGIEFVIMEVSAHAIEQKRINGINFDIGVLTNITQDHLDYFETFENYEKTKLKFLSKEYVKMGVICVDDNSAKKILGKTDIPILTYGIYNPCDIFAVDVSCSMEGSRFIGNVCDNVVQIKTNLIGEYNVYNSLAALAVCHSFGLNEKQLERGLNFINPVEGRFNVVNINGKHIVIDFAHSPDSLMNVLKTAKKLTDKKVYVVFGCGGNRDKGKRPQMGHIAEKYADYVCLTDDNPRFEKSADIISDIEQGMLKPHFVEPDRFKAIKKMIDLAKSGDIVIIAGKGAEKYQEVNGVKKPYNDFDAVYQYFQEKNPISMKKDREYYGC